MTLTGSWKGSSSSRDGEEKAERRSGPCTFQHRNQVSLILNSSEGAVERLSVHIKFMLNPPSSILRVKCLEDKLISTCLWKCASDLLFGFEIENVERCFGSAHGYL